MTRLDELDGTAPRWALVLAGGEGRRLQALTTLGDGTSVPKQFCSLHGGRTLLQDTLARVPGSIPAERVMTVVTRAHRRFWTRDLAGREHVVEQPGLRGTAAGILLPLLELADRSPDARLLLLPSDHHVEHTGRFVEACELALDCIEDDDTLTMLLGISPETADSEYGWIVPDEIDQAGRLCVRSFVEKPPLAQAVSLRHRGALWNSFVMASSVPALLGLFERHLPQLLAQVRRARTGGPEAIARAWPELPSHDFSADILSHAAPSLRLLPVAPCGWTDLGTPARIAQLARAHAPTLRAAIDEGVVLTRRSA